MLPKYNGNQNHYTRYIKLTGVFFSVVAYSRHYVPSDMFQIEYVMFVLLFYPSQNVSSKADTRNKRKLMLYEFISHRR
jgi:hypothetical protein